MKQLALIAVLLLASSATALTLDEVFAFASTTLFGVRATNIDSCQAITTPGVYNLVADVNATALCFEVRANDVCLNCQGHSVTGVSQVGSIAVSNRGNGFTLENCVIDSFTYGVIDLQAVSNQVVENNAFQSAVVLGVYPRGTTHDIRDNYFNSPQGVYAVSLSNSKIRDNFMDGDNIKRKSPVSAGILLEYDSSYNEITGNEITRYHEGIAFETPGTGTGNVVFNNKIYNNGNNGIILIFADETVIDSNDISGCIVGAGIHLYDAEDTVIKNNVLSNRKNLWIRSESINNVIYGNSFYFGNAFHINNAGSGNVFVEYVWGVAHGNYYDDIQTFLIYDMNNDGYGDVGYVYPYDSGEPKWQGSGSDSGPIRARRTNMVIE